MKENTIIDAGKTGPQEVSKRRREKIIILFVALFFALTTYFEFRLSNLSHRLPFVNSIFFFGLINFNIILLMVLVLLVARNIGKVFLERKRQAMGSRLKTKLVLAFLSFTIIPTGILFLISSFYINSSFDKWFSLKIQNTLQTSLEITQTYYKNTSRVAQYLATQVSNELREKWSYENLRSPRLKHYIERSRKLAAVDGVELYTDPLDERIIASSAREDVNQVLPRLPLDVLLKVFKGETASLVQHIGGADLIRAVSPIFDAVPHKKQLRGAVAVTFVIPVSLVNQVYAVSSVFQDYKDVNPLKYPVKSTYFIILIMMTLLIIFVSIWIGLYLARELTVPLERLVTATQKISQGDLDFQILNTGSDEIARLTDSFNQMTSELKKHRAELEATNLELAEKRTYVEAILNSVTAGVISVDSAGIVTTMNSSAAKLLNVSVKDLIHKNINNTLTGPYAPLAEMFNTIQSHFTSSQTPIVQKHFSLETEQGAHTLTATASSFGGGVVIVVDDTSYLTKVQREAAWREVARRIAHEIKNPLTPIKLSAQRLQKKFVTSNDNDAKILRECTDTIVKNVDELRDMVNEFSAFARFPAANPKPHDLNEVLKEVIILYEEAHRFINFTFEPEPRLPLVEFDRDQMKRVLINLLDNASAALRDAQFLNNKKIIIRTHYNEKLKIAMIEVADNGPGMTEFVRSRLFEPYFSTKASGTGLGLAIVKRIISDHSGFIRVQSAPDQGTKFTIELPVNLLESGYSHIQQDAENT